MTTNLYKMGSPKEEHATGQLGSDGRCVEFGFSSVSVFSSLRSQAYRFFLASCTNGDHAMSLMTALLIDLTGWRKGANEIDKKHYAIAVAIVPHLVFERIIENYTFAFVPNAGSPSQRGCALLLSVRARSGPSDNAIRPYTDLGGH